MLAGLGNSWLCKHEDLVQSLEPMSKVWIDMLVPQCWEGKERRGSLASQPSLPSELQANERPCLRKQNEWFPRNDGQGYAPASTCLHSTHALHTITPAYA